jgi:Lsr2
VSNVTLMALSGKYFARTVGGSLDLRHSRQERKGMVQRRLTSLVDDLNGTAAVETVRFGVGGPEYEIDLSAANARQLRSALAPFVSKARRLRAGQPATRRQTLRIGVSIDPDWSGSLSP